jgi:hypothetical protein
VVPEGWAFGRAFYVYGPRKVTPIELIDACGGSVFFRVSPTDETDSSGVLLLYIALGDPKRFRGLAGTIYEAELLDAAFDEGAQSYRDTIGNHSKVRDTPYVNVYVRSGDVFKFKILSHEGGSDYKWYIPHSTDSKPTGVEEVEDNGGGERHAEDYAIRLVDQLPDLRREFTALEMQLCLFTQLLQAGRLEIEWTEDTYTEALTSAYDIRSRMYVIATRECHIIRRLLAHDHGNLFDFGAHIRLEEVLEDWEDGGVCWEELRDALAHAGEVAGLGLFIPSQDFSSTDSEEDAFYIPHSFDTALVLNQTIDFTEVNLVELIVGFQRGFLWMVWFTLWGVGEWLVATCLRMWAGWPVVYVVDILILIAQFALWYCCLYVDYMVAKMVYTAVRTVIVKAREGLLSALGGLLSWLLDKITAPFRFISSLPHRLENFILYDEGLKLTMTRDFYAPEAVLSRFAATEVKEFPRSMVTLWLRTDDGATFRGCGVLIQARKRFYVLTAGHVVPARGLQAQVLVGCPTEAPIALKHFDPQVVLFDPEADLLCFQVHQKIVNNLDLRPATYEEPHVGKAVRTYLPAGPDKWLTSRGFTEPPPKGVDGSPLAGVMGFNADSDHGSSGGGVYSICGKKFYGIILGAGLTRRCNVARLCSWLGHSDLPNWMQENYISSSSSEGSYDRYMADAQHKYGKTAWWNAGDFEAEESEDPFVPFQDWDDDANDGLRGGYTWENSLNDPAVVASRAQNTQSNSQPKSKQKGKKKFKQSQEAITPASQTPGKVTVDRAVWESLLAARSRQRDILSGEARADSSK